MSYAGPSARSSGAPRTSPPARASAAQADSLSRSPRDRHPGQAPYRPDPTEGWPQLAIFGTGLALGIALGAGAALLAAPRTGAETRAGLVARVGRTRRTTARRGLEAWDDLRDELQAASRALRRRKAARELTRADL